MRTWVWILRLCSSKWCKPATIGLLLNFEFDANPYPDFVFDSELPKMILFRIRNTAGNTVTPFMNIWDHRRSESEFKSSLSVTAFSKALHEGFPSYRYKWSLQRASPALLNMKFLHFCCWWSFFPSFCIRTSLPNWIHIQSGSETLV
jgi:hypothetical protein